MLMCNVWRPFELIGSSEEGTISNDLEWQWAVVNPSPTQTTPILLQYEYELGFLYRLSTPLLKHKKFLNCF